MPSLKPELPVRAAPVVALALSFTAAPGCTRDPSDGTTAGGGGGSGSSGSLGDAVEKQTRLECECYIESYYGGYYYDDVDECVEQMSSYGIPQSTECIETALNETAKGRKYLACITDVVEQFNICVEKNGCASNGYYGLPRRCELEAELGYYECIDAVGGYAELYEIYEALYACFDYGYPSTPGYSTSGSYGTGGYDDDYGGYDDGYDGGSDFTCTNGQTIPSNWRCDDEEDCSDGSDEANCDPFTCGDGTQVPGSYVCDGEPDCADESDEATCMAAGNAHQHVKRLITGARFRRVRASIPVAVPASISEPMLGQGSTLPHGTDTHVEHVEHLEHLELAGQ